MWVRVAGFALLGAVALVALRRRKKKAVYFKSSRGIGRFVRRKLGLSSSADLRSVHVIFDFDHTLTSHDSPQCHDHLADVDVVAEEMRKYLDFGNGGHPELRGLPVGEWWVRVHKLLVDRKVSTAALEEARAKKPIRLRDGVSETLGLLLTLGVPVTVVSAGLEHVVEDVLEEFQTCTLADDCILRVGDALHLVANRLIFEDGIAVDAAPDPPVHAGNKHAVYDRLRPFFDDVVRTRPKLLVVGDSVGDVKAAANIPKSHFVSVAFYNPQNPWASRAKFDEAYDALLPHTASLAWLRDMLTSLP